MPALEPPELLEYVCHHALVRDAAKTVIRPLNGGVSSAIYLVEEEGRRFVTKQALEQLRVKAEWRCDPKRNGYEQEYLAWAERVMPGCAPRILHRDEEAGLFAMEYVEEGWTTWKARLMDGELEEETAREAGRVLGRLHGAAWGKAELARRFDNTELFRALRIAPYFLAMAERHPEWAEGLQRESEQLTATRLTLVHGDYSPKNLMTNGRGIKVLDAEVAWYGDPAFDVAFLSTHLLLKAVWRPALAGEYVRLQEEFLRAYAANVDGHWDGERESRAVRLTLMLMLARVAGKSPVEYLAPGSREAARVVGFASARLEVPPRDFAQLTGPWRQALTV